MTVQLTCRKCETVNIFEHNWIDHPCEACGAEGFWRRVDEPKVDYDLSANDRRFLRSLRIAPE